MGMYYCDDCGQHLDDDYHPMAEGGNCESCAELTNDELTIDTTILDGALAKLAEIIKPGKSKPDFTGYYCDLPVDIWYDYEPEQPAFAGTPAMDDRLTIGAVEFRGIDILPGIEKDDKDLAAIWDQAFDHAMQKERMNDGF